MLFSSARDIAVFVILCKWYLVDSKNKKITRNSPARLPSKIDFSSKGSSKDNRTVRIAIRRDSI